MLPFRLARINTAFYMTHVRCIYTFLQTTKCSNGYFLPIMKPQYYFLLSKVRIPGTIFWNSHRNTRQSNDRVDLWLPARKEWYFYCSTTADIQLAPIIQPENSISSIWQIFLTDGGLILRTIWSKYGEVLCMVGPH